VLDNGKDASLRTPSPQEAGAVVAKSLIDPSVASNIFHGGRTIPIILIVLPVPLNLALEDLPTAIKPRRARFLLEEDMLGGPNKRRDLARSQFRLNLVNRDSVVVDPRRRLGVQDGVHQSIRRPLLKKEPLLLHYTLLVRGSKLLHVLLREDYPCEAGARGHFGC